MKNKDTLKFQIDQLRKDKIIYAVDATAINLGALLFISYGYDFIPIPQGLMITLGIVVFAFAILFTLYAVISNVFRYRKIKELEKKL